MMLITAMILGSNPYVDGDEGAFCLIFKMNLLNQLCFEFGCINYKLLTNGCVVNMLHSIVSLTSSCIIML